MRDATPDGTQPDWRWCDRRQSLAYGDSEPGRCYVRGTHEAGTHAHRIMVSR
jgi:hypothetical protein